MDGIDVPLRTRGDLGRVGGRCPASRGTTRLTCPPGVDSPARVPAGRAGDGGDPAAARGGQRGGWRGGARGGGAGRDAPMAVAVAAGDAAGGGDRGAGARGCVV